ncbi:MAG: alpha/beta hydrolase [Anaerolineae bacterium]|nr:alpha/beta hydrolase [Anaerolineae bacterium]
MLRLLLKPGILGLIVLAVLPPLAAGAQSRPTPTYPDVLYVPGGSRTNQVLDIYLPEDTDGPFPVVFIIHEMGATKWWYADQAARLNDLGYAAVAIEYRGITRAVPLGPVNDSFCALAWLHAYAGEYDLDPARVVVFGHSLGGYPAAMLGTVDDASRFMEGCPHPMPESPWMQGVIVYAGALLGPATRAYPFLSGVESSQAAGYLDTLLAMPPQTWHDNRVVSGELADFAQLLPHTWVDGSEPPFLLIHGLIDTKVPVEESEQFAAVLEDAGAEMTLLLLPEAGHGLRLYQSVPTPEVDEAVEDFLARMFSPVEAE